MESKITQNEAIPRQTDKKQKKKTNKRFIPRIGCLRIQENETQGGGSGGLECNDDGSITSNGDRVFPSHLVIMVHGIIGSAENWKFAAKQFSQRYQQDVVVHCSDCNSAMLTFDGVDVMGERLAEEVISVINRWPRLQKISFVAHSLGGLVARYAIGRLYRLDISRETDEGNGIPFVGDKSKGKIAGLEPMNFITFATPHLGTRGHKQVPLFCSLRVLEQAARRTSWMLRKTGKHLFLNDNENGKPPLLVQMVNDCGDLKFMSALQSFQRRVTYSNARFDFIVGWRTSSIRRKHELPKLQRTSKNDRYPHIVNFEAPRTAIIEQEVRLKDKVKELKTSDMEEFMIQGLTKVGWERVDVSFRRSKQRFFAHSTIQVKSYSMNSDGADVISHMIDNFLL